jgi:hypothetical protein
MKIALVRRGWTSGWYGKWWRGRPAGYFAYLSFPLLHISFARGTHTPHSAPLKAEDFICGSRRQGPDAGFLS